MAREAVRPGMGSASSTDHGEETVVASDILLGGFCILGGAAQQPICDKGLRQARVFHFSPRSCCRDTYRTCHC